MSKRSFRFRFILKFLLFPYFLLFLVFKYYFIICVDLPLSQLQTQQVMTSQIRSHKIFNADLLYSCARFVVEIGEKSSLNGGF